MATYRRDELRDAVLQELGVIDAQGAPSPEDAKIATDRCQQQLEYLYDQGLIPFDVDGDEIPARFFIPLVSVIAYNLMLPYGVNGKAQILTMNAARNTGILSRLKNHRYMGGVVRSEYF